MFDLTRFSIEDMYGCSAALRGIAEDVADADAAARQIVAFLFDGLRIADTGEPACRLVRLFRTVSFASLPASEQTAVVRSSGAVANPGTMCLSLRASRGILPEWNDPRQSRGHRLIPLASASAIASMPMVSGLVAQLGLPAGLFSGAPFAIEDPSPLFDVFHVERALGSPYVPDQRSFVEPFGIRSALGFGGALPPAEVFVVILFSAVTIPRKTADLFRTLAPSVGLGLLGPGRDAASLETRIKAYERVVRYHEQAALQHQRKREQERETLLSAERAAAQMANRAKDDFLAVLGHELRNPLSPISTALELMKLRGMKSREQEIIERQAGHLARLVDDLLDVSRITRGKTQLHRAPVEIGAVVARAVEMASPLFEEKSQRLYLDVPEHGLLVHADAGRLSQVVSNLLTNASKFSAKGSAVRVMAELAGARVVLRVRDEGVGIASDMLEVIFQSFVQHRGAGEHTSGLGLGLAIVKSLVELHGGNVVARSDGRGKGSELTVDLPLFQRTAAVSGCLAEAGAPDAGTSRKRRILIVDDNLDAGETLGALLSEIGHEVRVVSDGPSGLKVAKTFRPEVLLLDIGLPLMDGYELARGLRDLAEVPNGARYIAISGYGQDADRRRSLEAGFVAHLVKPVTPAELAAAVDAGEVEEA